MKQRIHLFFSIFFILSTLSVALHELSPQHNSAECQVCTLVQQDTATPPELTSNTLAIHHIPEHFLHLISQYEHKTQLSVQARAPPRLFI